MKYTVFLFCSNLLSLSVLVGKQLRLRSTCLYMAYIAITDAALLAVNLVSWLNRVDVNTNSVHSCKFMLFSFYFLAHFSTSLLVAMTIERFVAIRFPLRALTLITPSRTRWVIAIIFILVFGLNVNAFWTRTMVQIDGTPYCMWSSMADIDSKHGIFHVYFWPWIGTYLLTNM